MTSAKIVLAGLVALVATVYAWPPPDEVVKTKPIVDELMSAKGALAPADEAEAANAFAEEANGEAAKYLLLRRAVELYAKAGDDGRTADAFQKLVKDVKDVPPAVQERILLDAGRTLAKRVRPLRTEALFKGVRALVWAEKELVAARMELKGSKKDDPAANLRAGNALAVLGDWPKALEHLRGTQGKIAPVAEHEIKGTATADKLANAWWKASAAAESEYVKNVYRRHSVELYRKALEDNLLEGLGKTLARNRISEFEKESELSAGPAAGDTSGGRESPRVANAASVDNRPPSGKRYCIVDLSAGPEASRYPVSYLTAEPISGFNTDEYKTTKLVLRRIEPGKFMMCGQYAVTLTKPFFIGVFEVTQRQYELVMGHNPAQFQGDKRPVERVSYNMIRGSVVGAQWPSSSAVDSDSFMGKLRARTKLEFDLPTEAQWEYACRAGTTSDYNNGGNSKDDLRKLGRYKDNQFDHMGGYSSKHTTVGSYKPNRWGLYDMHGNEWEWCLDWKEDLLSGNTDPKGPSSGLVRVLRGGAWNDPACDCTSTYRGWSAPRDELNRFGDYYGFRLALPVSDAGVASGEARSVAATERTSSKPVIVAQNNTSDVKYKFNYRLDSKGNAILCGNPCVSPKPIGALVVPDSIDGHKVVGFDGWAFGGCDQMTSIKLPAYLKLSVTYCGWSCPGCIFGNCSSLKRIDIDGENSNLTTIDGALYSKDMKTLISWPRGRSEIKLNPKTTNIDGSAFSGWPHKTLKLPEGIEAIGILTFECSPNLEVVEFPKSIGWLGPYTFRNCPRMKKVVFHGDAPTAYARRTARRENMFWGAPDSVVVDVKKGTRGWNGKGSTNLPEFWPLDGNPKRRIRYIP